MASYAKQLMEQAAKWLEANPDPDDAFVRTPSKEFDSQDKVDNDVAETRRRMQPFIETHPEARVLLDDLETTNERRRQVVGEIKDVVNQIDKLVNDPPEAIRGKFDDDPGLTLGPWLLAWARHGYNNFELSPSFTAAMLLTDPTEIDIQSIRLPFRGMLLTLPTGFARGSEGTEFTKVHVWEASGEQVKLRRVGARIRDEIAPLDAPTRQRVLDKLAEHIEEGRILERRDGTIVLESASTTGAPWILIHATDGVRTFLISVEMHNLTWQVIEELPNTNIDNDTDRHAHHTIQQVVFGTLAYLSAVKDAATPRETQRKKLKKSPTPDEVKHWEIGRDVRIDPRLIQSARGGSREIAFHIENRFIVRGHYRNQAHGVGRAERKRIWVQPFWKGPEEGARIVHTYKPEKPTP